MRDSFYMVLSSNGSRNIFADNTASRFTILSPQNFDLQGDWCVALTEIQIPLTFQHILRAKRDDIVRLNVSETEFVDHLTDGVYDSVESLLEEINSLSTIKDHLRFRLLAGGFVEISKTCDEMTCEFHPRNVVLSKKLAKIIGFEDYNLNDIDDHLPVIGTRPASLSTGLPETLSIYSDICEPYVTGDTQTRLLRVVPLALDNYRYGGVEIKNFALPMYIPLLSASFRSIEIDIRDAFGNSIPFDYGTLTVTLHFKRIE